jgi:cardiolipin synthase
MVWIFWLYLINTFFMISVAISDVRKPARALLWLCICLILPIIGFGLYLSITNPLIDRRARLTLPYNESDTLPASYGRSASVIAQSIQHLTVHGLRSGQVEVLANGIETYGKLIKSIQRSQKTVDIEYFLYRDDAIGRKITDLLIERSNSGVHVRFMRDGWGSRKFPKEQVVRMIAAGIEVRTFYPLRFPWLLSNWNYRDHCKNVVIDGKAAFTGGINIGDEYTGLKPNVGYWRDTHFRISGEVASDLQHIFDAHWKNASPDRSKIRTFIQTQKSKDIQLGSKGAYSAWSTEWSSEVGNNLSLSNNSSTQKKEVKHQAFIQTLEGNPGIPTPIIQEAYFISLTQATRTIDISTPYFVPEADIIMAIKTAVTRGVQVRLLLPRHSDQKMADLASYTYFGELLEAGVHISHYTKGMMHAKLMVIDGEISITGTANYDLKSFRLEYNLCEFIYSTDMARELTEQFEHDLNDCVPLHLEDFQHRSLPQRVAEQGARLLSPLL